jgi:hypothetical protein
MQKNAPQAPHWNADFIFNADTVSFAKDAWYHHRRGMRWTKTVPTRRSDIGRKII